MPRYPHVSTDDVVRLYQSGKSAGAIVAVIGMTEANVYRRLKLAGITRRSVKDRFPNAFHPTQEIIAMYAAGRSCPDIGATLGISCMTVTKRLRNSGITLRPAGSGTKGKFLAGKSPMWKGGRHINDKGYVKVWAGANGNYVSEHRLVMEQKLGRKLTHHEHVHHLNGIRDDNRPQNLELTDIRHHERGTFVKMLQRRIRELESQLHHSK